MSKNNLGHRLYRNIPKILGVFSNKYQITPIQEITIKEIPSGSIIDIGAGGEGVIAQAGGARVTAIDKRQSEIDEAKDKAPKAKWVVADATNLPFDEEEFDNATSFFCGMYMSNEDKRKSIKEIWRVLPSGGEFWIWDSKINTDKTNSLIFLRITLPNNKKIGTGYGTNLTYQAEDMYREYLEEAGFNIKEVEVNKHWFFIKAKKT